MKSWKKRWIEELDEKVHSMRDDVKFAPICTEKPVANDEKVLSRNSLWQNVTEWIAAHRKPFFAGVATFSAAVVTAVAVLPALLNVAPKNATAIAVQINPCAVFSVDSDGNVAAVVAGNQDGDIILSDGGRVATMTGKPVAAAVEIFVEYAEDLGFIDYQTASTVTVSGCEDATVADGVKSALQTFFEGKHAETIVRSDTLTFDRFCNVTGVVADSVNALGETLKDLPVLSTVRAAANKALDELKTEYQALVLSDLPELIRGELQTDFEKVRKHYEDIQAIYELNNDIVVCERPISGLAYLLKNYWELKESGDYTAYGDELNGLLVQMGGLLEAYKNDYGVELLSYEQMNAVWSEYLLLSVEQIEGLLLNVFTDTILSLHLASLVDVFENIVDIAWMTDLYEQPQTQAEYAAKMSVYYNKKYHSLSVNGTV